MGSTSVRERLAQHKVIQNPIEADMLERFTEDLQVAATAETKDGSVTHSTLSRSFLETELRSFVADIGEMERNFTAPLQKATSVYLGEAVAANYIGFLHQVSQQLGCVDLKLKEVKLCHPLLLLDRASALIELLEANKKQEKRIPLSEAMGFRLSAIEQDIRQLRKFYDHDLEALIRELLEFGIHKNCEAFITEAKSIQQAFYTEKIEAARHKQLEALEKDKRWTETNIRQELHFKVPDEWKRFYYRFGHERYGPFWVYHNTPYVGRRYIHNDDVRPGPMYDRWRKRIEDYCAARGFEPGFYKGPFLSCFQTALSSFPYSQIVSGADGQISLTDDQASAEYNDTWGSLQSEWISFEEFVEELAGGTSSGLDHAGLLAFTQQLHDFNETVYQAEKKLAYQSQHRRHMDNLDASSRTCATPVDVPASLILNSELDKELPKRLIKPRAGCRGMVLQGLWIDINTLNLHPSLRQLENRGVGVISLEYDISSQTLNPFQNTLTFTLFAEFKYYALDKTAIPLLKHSVTRIVSNIYRMDEIVFLLWNTGEYATGERRDLSCTLISNVRPVPELPKAHPLLLNDLNIQLNVDVSAMVEENRSVWQKELAERLIARLEKSSEPMRHYFKRMEVYWMCVKAFLYLVHHQDPSIKAFLEKPHLVYFQEEGFLRYLEETSDDNLEGFYRDLYRTHMDGQIKMLKIPDTLRHPQLEQLLRDCEYFQGVAKNDQFMEQIKAARAIGRLEIETLVEEISSKQVLVEQGLAKVETRQAEDEAALQKVLCGSDILVRTGIFPAEGLAHLEAAFEEMGCPLPDEDLLEEDETEDSVAIERLQAMTKARLDELGVILVEDVDSEDSDDESEEPPQYWDILNPWRLQLPLAVRLTEEQKRLLIERLAGEGFILKEVARGMLQVIVSKTANALQNEPSYKPDGLFPLLLNYWAKDMPSEEVCLSIERLLKGKSKGSIKALVNEVELKTGKTPLHLACEQGSIELVKLLLSEEADTTIKDKSDKSCWAYAPTMAQEACRALVETRGAWQAKAKDLGFSFNRALWLIEHAMEYFADIGTIEIPGVLFVGPTRAGKSTLMNACLGTRYQRAPGKRYVEPVDGDREIATVGHRSTSETMHPNIHLGTEYALIDCPGFDETRGLAETICHGVSFHALEEQLELIKGMVLVCDEHDIAHPFLSLRRSLEQLGRMTMILPEEELAKNICLMITKTSGDETLVEALREWLEEDFSEITVDSDEKEWAVKRVLAALVSTKDSVMLADVTSPDSMAKVRAKIASLQAQEKKHYDFSRPQHELQVFRNFLTQMLGAYQALNQETKSLQHGLMRMYFERLAKDTHSFPVTLSVLKEELMQLQEIAEIVERIDNLEDTIQQLKKAEVYSEGLDTIRQNLLYILNYLLDNAEKISTGAEKELQQALKARFAELDVNRVFFEQIERIAAMIGGLKASVIVSSSPAFFKPTPAKEQWICLPDGNCAYNSIALFLRDAFLNLEEDHPFLVQALLVIPTLEALNDLTTISAVKTYFSAQRPEETQRIMAPKLRRKVVNDMRTPEHGYQTSLLERLQQVMLYRRDNPMDFNIPDADTFFVHPFIREQCTQVLREHPKNEQQQKEALSTWWNEEGFARYLEVIEEPARSAGDIARWGGAPELDRLGKIFHADIRLCKDGRGFEHIGDDEAPLLECQLHITGAHWSYTKKAVTSAPTPAMRVVA